MRIIQVQTQAEAAGAQRISDMVGDGLRSGGHDIQTVFMYRKTNVYDDDPHAVFISDEPPKGPVDQIRAAFGLIKYIRQQKPDAVITYQYWGNLFGAIGARFAATPCIIANQSGAPVKKGLPGIASRLDKLIGSLGWYDFNIVNSAWTEQQFEHYPPRYRARLSFIEHGVFRSGQVYDKMMARTRFGLPHTGKVVISTGRITADKNQAVLVEILAILPDIHVAIAGAGPAQEELEHRAEELGVVNRLHFAGEISPDKIGEFLATADVFAFPSLFETFGLAVVEAAIAGVPVVANDLQILRDVLTTEENGPAAIFASSQNVNTFSRAISDLAGDEKLSAQLTRAGKALAEKYAIDKMCNAYEQLLLQKVEGPDIVDNRQDFTHK